MSSVSGVSHTLGSWMGCAAQDLPQIILRACQQGDLTSLKNYWPADSCNFVNQPINGKLLLNEAVCVGATEVIAFLLENGAKPDLADSKNMNAWEYAKLSSQNKELLSLLIKKGVETEVQGLSDFLNVPVNFSRAHSVCEALRGLILPDSQPQSLPTTEQEWTKLCQMASVRLTFDVDGNTLMHYFAAARNATHLKLLEGLLQRGVSANLLNKAGQTPVHVACAMESMRSLKTLLRHGGSMGQVDGEGISPLALIGARAKKKDPMNIETMRIFLALVVATTWIADCALDAESGKAWYITRAQLVILISESLFARYPNRTIAEGVRWTALFILFSNSQYNDILRTCLNAIGTLNVGYSALQGLYQAWEYRKWRPLKALSNAVIHSINLSYAALTLPQRVDEFVRGVRLHPFEREQEKFIDTMQETCKKEIAVKAAWEDKLASIKKSQENFRCMVNKAYPICRDLPVQLQTANEGIESSQALLEECRQPFEEGIGKNARKIAYVKSLPFLDLFKRYNDQKASMAARLAELAQVSFESIEFEKNPARYGKKLFHGASLLTHPDKIKDSGKAQAELNELYVKFTQVLENEAA